MRTLMIQGTTSDAGKSTLVTALCRIYARQGMHVAPFKPQNMALNSAVTEDGGEIGRAQAVQAKAANVPLSVHFNPVLLKPQSDKSAQIIVQGQALDTMSAQDYQHYKRVAKAAVFESHQILESHYDRVVVEGAGSPAEINLREGDIANMGFAEQADCPVILIADIDKGGVFAHLVGTLDLLSKSEQARVVGFVINRFRGDIKILEPGLEWLEQKTGKPVLGVLPYIHGLAIAAEDAVNIEQDADNALLNVVVPVTPRMSNHNDFDALRLHPQINLTFAYASELEKRPLPAADLIILAGSKNTREDLAFIKEQGWDQQITKHLRYGGKLLGICGGYQMLGELISDPLGLEGEAGDSVGLGLLPLQTELAPNKVLANTTATMHLGEQPVQVSGYEIHMGRTQSDVAFKPMLTIGDSKQGVVSADNCIAGCYLHGLFDQAEAITALANWCGVTVERSQDLETIGQRAIDVLADRCEAHLDLQKIEQILEQWNKND